MKALFDRLTAEALRLGANRAAVIAADQIETDRIFRDMCAANACGVYGKCWMCPPDVGEIEELMAREKQYDHALVYQRIGQLEDSFDVEGMAEAKVAHRAISFALRKHFRDLGLERSLHLGAGGCGVCKPCSKIKGEPCAHPDLAMSSLEAYGINVSRMAQTAGMNYINGANTVTYFGVVLFSLPID